GRRVVEIVKGHSSGAVADCGLLEDHSVDIPVVPLEPLEYVRNRLHHDPLPLTGEDEGTKVVVLLAVIRADLDEIRPRVALGEGREQLPAGQAALEAPAAPRIDCPAGLTANAKNGALKRQSGVR